MKTASAATDTLREREHGIALPIALFALLVVDVLVFGSFAAARLEQQAGDNTVYTAQAFEAAETGLTSILAQNDPVALAALSPGGPPLSLGTIAAGAGLVATLEVVRLTARVFLIRALGTRTNADGVALAQRRLGLLVRLAAPPTSGSQAAGSTLVPLAERAWISLS
jgi:hypothetical protein